MYFGMNRTRALLSFVTHARCIHSADLLPSRKEENDKRCETYRCLRAARPSVFRTPPPSLEEGTIGRRSIAVHETAHDHVCAEAADRFRGTFLRK